MSNMSSKTETAWVIELDIPMYVCVDNCHVIAGLGLTSDHMKALRFARQEDAEAAIKLLPFFKLCLPEGSKGAVEHSWVTAPGRLDLPDKTAKTSRSGAFRDRIRSG